MPMTSHWSAIAPSQFPWEREALDWLREHLPNAEPWHAWSNFEFLDDEGRVNEVDTLVLSPQGLFLIEIKSRPGVLTGDAHTWTWSGDGRRFTDDNPLILTNRKAKRLASAAARRRPSMKKARGCPGCSPWCSYPSTGNRVRLDARRRARLGTSAGPPDAKDRGPPASSTPGRAAGVDTGAPGACRPPHRQER